MLKNTRTAMRSGTLQRVCKNGGRLFHSSARYPLGIAFDIDGVLVRGGQPIEGACKALQQLFVDPQDPCQIRIPHIFLTNGGGVPESVKALELSSLLGVKILPQQLFLGHTPFKTLKDRFESANVLAIGKGEPCTVMSSYGYRNVVSMEEYVEHFKDIDPLAKYKKWSTNNDIRKNTKNVYSSNKAIDAVFVVSDPVDWGRDIQVLCDVLRSGGYPGRSAGNQPYLYFAADDLEYQAAFPVERLGMGAFRIALESIYNGISKTPLVYTSFGKPSVPVFRGSEIALLKLAEIVKPDVKHGNFARLYMIGDNPYTDILGAKQAGAPWFSILTRTGCFKGEDNHDQYKADLVVDDVLEAVQYIMKEHKIELLQH